MKKIFFSCLCCIVLIGISSSRSGAQTFVSAWHMPDMCTSLSDSGGFEIIGYTSSDSIVINFGDGTSLGFAPYYVTVTGDTAYYYYVHHYSVPGVYTVSIYLSSGGVPVDTLTYIRNCTPCQAITLVMFVDNNSNCTIDGGDTWNQANPAVIKIDSAGVPVDTVTSNCGVYYNAYGPVGTVYTFTVITNPLGLLPTCPSTGVISVTVTSTLSSYSDSLGFECDPTACLDRWQYSSVFHARLTEAYAFMHIGSSSCTPGSTTATITFSPKYALSSVSGAMPYTVSGNVITYTVSGISATSTEHVGAYFLPVGTLTMGDTVQTTFAVPTSGDCNTSNNVESAIDTIKASWDPNDKGVKPAGDISPGTPLQYTLRFENLGNDTAHNVHLMDTLSDHLDISTIKQIASSAYCRMMLLTWAGHNIVKFDFPDIKLLDSSHHPGREGFVAFTINAKATLPPGTHIDNRAGIYFDSNPVVMTNNVRNTIPGTTGIATISNYEVDVYPNPVNDELTINVDHTGNYTVTIVNTLGQRIMTQHMNALQAKFSVKGLPSGIYYITVKGEQGVKVQKFEKL